MSKYIRTKDKQELVNKLGKLEEIIKDYDEMAKDIVELGLGVKVDFKEN